jgi:hypothetical protein
MAKEDDVSDVCRKVNSLHRFGSARVGDTDHGFAGGVALSKAVWVNLAMESWSSSGGRGWLRALDGVD